MADKENEYLLHSRRVLYDANLDIYPAGQFDLQERMAQTSIGKIGALNESIFNGLVACLSKSKMVKNKFRKMLQNQ